MRVLVSDTSVIIDLERGQLLEEVFRLPFTFAVPDLLFERELKDNVGPRLQALGLHVEELNPQELTEAVRVRRLRNRLSTPDTFAYAIARGRNWTLLSGDGELRSLALAESVTVHGVLWLIDQLEAAELLSPQVLHQCLTAIAAHPRCRLPGVEVKARLTRFTRS